MNWSKLLKELLESGFTQAELATSIGLKQSSIPDIIAGRQASVKWEVGNSILAMHRHFVGIEFQY